MNDQNGGGGGGGGATNGPRTRRTSLEKSKAPQLNFSTPGVFGIFFFLSVFLIFGIFFTDYTPVNKVLRFHSQILFFTAIEEQETESKTGETEARDVVKNIVFQDEVGGAYGPVATEYVEERETVAPGSANGGPVSEAGEAEAEEVKEKVGYLEEGGGACNIFEGNWMWDESYPLYESEDCPFEDGGFRCSENGRPDRNYTKWRWQPKDCNLPRFNARLMLEKLRNRRVAFIGDSIGRNQWESLLCMLSSAVPNKSSIYEVNGNPITKHMGFLIFKFKDFNCTVEYYRAPYLVVQGRPPAKSPANVRMTLKLDHMAWTSSQWKGADVLVFNAGHWWNDGKTTKGGCYFEQRGKVNMNMTVENAFEKSMETLVDWIDREVDLNKSLVFLRSYAPVHYSGGNWNNGGGCHLQTQLDLGEISYKPSVEARITTDVFMELVEKKGKGWLHESVKLLNVSEISSRRKDGHSSIYISKPLTPLNRQDCSHWCLPGVPDTWNELLYSVFLRKELDSAGKLKQT